MCTLELRGSSCQHNMFVCGGDPVDVCSESLIPSHIYTSGLIKHEGSRSVCLFLFIDIVILWFCFPLQPINLHLICLKLQSVTFLFIIYKNYMISEYIMNPFFKRCFWLILNHYIYNKFLYWDYFRLVLVETAAE